MTAGALYQLKLRNAENNFLDFDPQITFLKLFTENIPDFHGKYRF